MVLETLAFCRPPSRRWSPSRNTNVRQNLICHIPSLKLEPLADESESPRLYDYAIRVVSRVSRWKRLLVFGSTLLTFVSRSILGPTLGGALARPVLSYPELFHAGSIWDRFPYLLPNLVCTMIVTCGVGIGILFLEETHEEKKHRRDPGLEAGKWILSKVTRCAESKSSNEKEMDMDEVLSLLSDDDQPPNYRTNENSLSIPSTPSADHQEVLDLNDSRNAASPAATKAFTRQVVRNIVGYGILA